jgi:hypothetical protein
MSYFIKQGNSWQVSDSNAVDIHDHLPPGNYIVQANPMSGALYLEEIDGFESPPKIYGSAQNDADRILRTFLDRPSGTGVVLNGEKGSGKTLLAKILSIDAAAQGIPSIVVNAPWKGDAFNKLVQDIDQPAIIMFDEFEKTYSDRDDQTAVLTLLDGVYPSKKLFIMTCNDKYRIDSHMRNRPGRIYYMMDFKGLEIGFIEEYCKENLINQDHVNSICNLSSLFGEFNFDMLKAMVEEMNRYNESPQQVIRLLNTKPEFSTGSTYMVTLEVAGIIIDMADISGEQWDGNPMGDEIEIDYKVLSNSGPTKNSRNQRSPARPTPRLAASSKSKKVSVPKPGSIRPPIGDDAEWHWHEIYFDSEDLVEVDSKAGKFIFEEQEDNARLTLTKKAVAPARWMDLF